MTPLHSWHPCSAPQLQGHPHCPTPSHFWQASQPGSLKKFPSALFRSWSQALTPPNQMATPLAIGTPQGSLPGPRMGSSTKPSLSHYMDTAPLPRQWGETKHMPSFQSWISFLFSQLLRPEEAGFLPSSVSFVSTCSYSHHHPPEL